MKPKSKFIIILLCAAFTYTCSNKKTNQVNDFTIVENRYYYPQIDSLVNIYDRNEFFALHNQELFYPVEDSLCLYFSQLNRKELYEDNTFKYIAGKLLEKAYLQEREIFYKPESFPVYNTSILYDEQQSHGFALKIVMGETFNIDSVFDIYAHPWQDFLCIDSVILTLDKLPEMQKDSNHQTCISLVRDDKTGGCLW